MPANGEPRYRVGCAGMFVLGIDYGVDDEDEAIAACESPVGCEVYDTVTGNWFGPTCREEIESAKARLERRARSGGGDRISSRGRSVRSGLGTASRSPGFP